MDTYTFVDARVLADDKVQPDNVTGREANDDVEALRASGNVRYSVTSWNMREGHSSIRILLIS